MAARSDRLRYVALGDSYTVGTSVDPSERWPNQLVKRLGGRDAPIRLAANLGVNGFTSADVIRVELPRLAELEPGLASLLIGVNDVVQGVPVVAYRENAARILDELLRRLEATRVVTVSTPDYTVTPAGADYGDPVARAAGIREVNTILAQLAAERQVAFVDIHDLSLRATGDRSLVADDGLHPSGVQYTLWVDRIAPVVRDLLAQPSAG
jgi:lysophospholipase L1-like esterase